MIRGNPAAKLENSAQLRDRKDMRAGHFARLAGRGLVGAAIVTLFAGLVETAFAGCASPTPAYCTCSGGNDVPNAAAITAHLRGLLTQKRNCVAGLVAPQTQNPALSQAFSQTLDQAINAATRLITPGPGLSCSGAAGFVREKEEMLENIGAMVLERAIHVEGLFNTFKEKMSQRTPNDPEKYLAVPDPNLPFKIEKAKKFFKKLPDSRGGRPTDFPDPTPEKVIRRWLAEQLQRKVLTYIAGSEYIDRVYGRLPDTSGRQCTYPPVLGLYQGYAPNLLNLFSTNPEVNGGCPAPGTTAGTLRTYLGWEHCHVINPYNASKQRLKGPNGGEDRIF